MSAAEVLGLILTSENTTQPNEEEGAASTQEENTNNSERKTFDTNYDKPYPVKELKEVDLGQVTYLYRKTLREMLRECTTMWNGSLGEVSTAKHCIGLLPSTRPIAQHTYHAAPKARMEEQFQVKKMLHAGVIDPIQSPWASTVVLAPKRDRSWHFVSTIS